MKSKKIVWMSRHAPLPSQIRELDRLYPGHTFVADGRPFSDAADIVKRFHSVGGDELIVVAPLNVVNEIVKAGVQPLIAKMARVPYSSPEAEVVLGRNERRRGQRFVRFERCTGVETKVVQLSEEKENENVNSNTPTH